MMRAMERLAVRASLPLRYSQGFNPRPLLSLVCPRPVGIASRDDVLVLQLQEPVEADRILSRLNAHAPPGLEFLAAQAIPAGSDQRLRRAAYELPLPPGGLAAVSRKLDQLNASQSWPVERLTSERRHATRLRQRTIDIRPLVSELALSGAVLRMTLAPQGDLWARPGEVLRALGMDEQLDLPRITRTEVQYD